MIPPPLSPHPNYSLTPRIPLYTLTKTVIFLYLASPATGGTPYVYNAVLAPLFAEHEPEIDAFLTSLRGRAGSGARGGLGWIWETVRKALGVSTRLGSAEPNGAG